MPSPATPPELSAAVRDLVAAGAVLDAHVDSIQLALDLGHDLCERGPGQLDLRRGAEGGLGAVVLACWPNPMLIGRPGGDPVERAGALLGAVRALAARHPERVQLVGNGRQLEAARAAGRVALIAGIEGGHGIGGDLEILCRHFERGLRVLTLVWNNHLDWIRSCQPDPGPQVPEGLSAFGREVVGELNRLGVVVDLSHAGERSFYDALEATARPPIASHSGCHALHDHPRNLTDDQLRALAAAGGVVGIVFHPGFLDADARAEEGRVYASEAMGALGQEPDTAVQLERSRLTSAAAAPMPAERLVEHVLHAAEVAGVEHVGLGSDFDGILRTPQWIEDASRYPVLLQLLLERGLSPAEVDGIAGGNLRRVFTQVTGPGTRAHEADVEVGDV